MNKLAVASVFVIAAASGCGKKCLSDGEVKRLFEEARVLEKTQPLQAYHRYKAANMLPCNGSALSVAAFDDGARLAEEIKRAYWSAKRAAEVYKAKHGRYPYAKEDIANDIPAEDRAAFLGLVYVRESDTEADFSDGLSGVDTFPE